MPWRTIWNDGWSQFLCFNPFLRIVDWSISNHARGTYLSPYKDHWNRQTCVTWNFIAERSDVILFPWDLHVRMHARCKMGQDLSTSAKIVHRGKYFIISNSVLLSVAQCNKECFVFVKTSIWFYHYFIDPFMINRSGIRGTKGKDPMRDCLGEPAILQS